MHHIKIFFLILFTLYTPLPAMENYEKKEYEIVNKGIFTTHKKTPISNYPIHIDSNGIYLVSNYHNSKVLVCFAGNFKENKEAQNPSVIAYNPLSLLDVKTGINKPFQLIPELSNNTPVSALHIINNNTYAIGHDNNLYLLQETNNLNIFSDLKPKIKIIHILSPSLSDNTDKIHTIDSSHSHLIAVSAKGHITLWQKNEKIINTTTLQTVHCTQPFFSAIFNKKENLLCLGLANGKLFITDINNLCCSHIIAVFPLSTSTIDYLDSYNDNIVACSFEFYKSKDTNNPFCCKKNWHYDPTCKECKDRNYKNVYNNTITCSATEIDTVKTNLKKQLDELNKQKCEHVIAQLEQRPEMCNYHRRDDHPFSVENALFSAQELKFMLVNKNSMIPNSQPVLNENLFKKIFYDHHSCKERRPENKQILRMQLISNDQALIHVFYKRIDRWHLGSEGWWTNEIYLTSIKHTTTYTIIFDHLLEHYEPKRHDHKNTLTQLHIIPTEADNMVILEKSGNEYKHLVIDSITQFIKKNNNTLPASNVHIKEFLCNNKLRYWSIFTCLSFLMPQILFYFLALQIPMTVLSQILSGLMCSLIIQIITFGTYL